MHADASDSRYLFRRWMNGESRVIKKQEVFGERRVLKNEVITK